MRRRHLRIRLALWTQGRTQADLAEQLGVDPAVVSRIVNGRVRPSAEQRQMIAAFLRVPEGELFADTG